MVLCSKWQSRLLKPSELLRTTRTKETGTTKEGSHQLKATYKVVVEECKAVVGEEA